MVISGKFGVQDVSCSKAVFIRLGNTNDRAYYRVREEEREWVRNNVFKLRHIKLKVPRRLPKKMLGPPECLIQ